MKLLARLLRWLGLSMEIERAGICVVCGHGTNPVLGLPIPTTDGRWKHLVCMTVGSQIAQVADQAARENVGTPVQPQQQKTLVLGVFRSPGPESWN